MSKSDEYKVVTLVDEPSDNDEFGGDDLGPHQRVADAIAEAIMNDKNLGGRMIGIEGHWGGGKSTVVRLVAKAFGADPALPLDAQSKQTLFFLFDTWEHQGDALRRSFLETLIARCVQLEWLRLKGKPDKDRTWQDVLNELAGQVTKERIRSHRQVNPLAACLVFVVVLTPTGLGLFERGLATAGSLDLSASFNWPLFLGGLCLLPLTAVILKLLWALAHGWRAFVKALSLFDSNASRAQTTTRLQKASPSSVEFKCMFEMLLHSVDLSRQRRRLIIVLDNLDRLPEEEALAVWSTMQTFLPSAIGMQRESSWSRTVVLVPYAREAMQEVWATSSNGENPWKFFVQKSFAVRFDVPPVVPVDWRAYLDNNMKEAMKSATEGERQEAIAVFDVWSKHHLHDPTPRELKDFVNSIGAIRRQWACDEVGVSAVAYFVLLRREVGDVAKFLRMKGNWSPSGDDDCVKAGRECHETMLRYRGKGVEQELAGLCFNVRRDRGMEFLLRGEIQQALRKREPQVLQDFADRYGQFGFWDAFAVIVIMDAASVDLNLLGNMAATIDDLGWHERWQGDERGGPVNAIWKRFQESEGLVHLDEPLANGLVTILRWWPRAEVADKAVTCLRMALLDSTLDGRGERVVERAEQAVRVLAAVREVGLDHAIDRPLSLNLSAESWIQACGVLTRVDPDGRCWGDLWCGRELETNDVIGHIRSSITDKHCDQSVVASVRVTARRSDGEWTELCSKIEKKLTVELSDPVSAMHLLTQCLVELEDANHDVGRRLLKKMNEQGALLHWHHRSHEDKEPEAQAFFMYCIVRDRPGLDFDLGDVDRRALLDELGHMLQNPEGFEVVAREFLALLHERNEEESLWSLRERNQRPRPFVQACLLEACGSDEEEHLAKFLSAERIVNEADFLLESVNPEPLAKILTLGVRKLGLCRHMQRTYRVTRATARLPRTIVEEVERTPREFLDWCSVQLGSWSESEWRAEMRREGNRDPEGLMLLLRLYQTEHTPAVAVSFCRAVEECSSRVVDEFGPELLRGPINAVLGSGSLEAQEALAEAVEANGGFLPHLADSIVEHQVGPDKRSREDQLRLDFATLHRFGDLREYIARRRREQDGGESIV